MKKLTTVFVLIATLLTTSLAFGDIIVDPMAQTAPAMTVEQKQAKLKRMVSFQINQEFKNLINTFHVVMGEIWQNQDGLSPQESFDAFGTDAVQTLVIANALITMVNTIKPNMLSGDTPNPLTPNKDGSVTVGA